MENIGEEFLEQKYWNSEGAKETAKRRTKMQDMKQLADIHKKSLQGEELLEDDLRFLYEIDKEIHSTGYGYDPRIAQILKGRDIKEDLSLILNTSKDKISTTQKGALSGDIVFHYGNLHLGSLTSDEKEVLRLRYPHLAPKIL